MSDPATVGNSLGELIREEMESRDPVAQRIIANRVRLAIEEWIKAGENPPQPVPPMNDAEVRRCELEIMPFGKHHGEQIRDVPFDYLEWLADESRNTWRKLHAYLNNHMVKEKRERCNE